MSSAPAGRRAAFHLLDSTGHRVLQWRSAPAALQGPGSLLIVSAGATESERAAGPRADKDPRSSTHYRTFLESGGRILADARASSWLANSVGIELEGSTFAEPRAEAVLRTPGGEEWSARLEDSEGLPRSVGGAAGVPLLVDQDGSPFAALYAVGAGSLLLVHDAGIWRNDRIREADHAYMLLALAGLAGGNRTVLFDDFVLGVYEPPGALHMLFFGRAAPLGWSLALFAFLGLATVRKAWRFKRDPRAESEVNPFLRVRSGAQLLERARRPAQIADRLRSGVKARLVRRLRVHGDEDEALARLLAAHATSESEAQRWAEMLHGELPSSRKDLERWALELNTIEHAVEDSLRRDTQVGAGFTPRWKHG